MRGDGHHRRASMYNAMFSTHLCEEAYSALQHWITILENMGKKKRARSWTYLSETEKLLRVLVRLCRERKKRSFTSMSWGGATDILRIRVRL